MSANSDEAIMTNEDFQIQMLKKVSTMRHLFERMNKHILLQLDYILQSSEHLGASTITNTQLKLILNQLASPFPNTPSTQQELGTATDFLKDSINS